MNPIFAMAVEIHVQMLGGMSFEDAYADTAGWGDYTAKAVAAWGKLNATGRESVMGIVSRRWERSTPEQRNELLERARAGVCG